ncbi:glycerate kinase [Micromonospora sp. H33]|uniref:glycerate kinase n=1 Tax=Micromonospora sp. H33 TaxID=3452215 RepID=UPI003F8A57B6
MHVVIAPDSFKGSISAGAAATAIADGWRSVRPYDELSTVPLADGGEGTLDVLAAAHEGAIWQQRMVQGPHGNGVSARWLLLPDGTAVVELAEASGLVLTDRLDALSASTYGFGQLLAAAARHPSVSRLVVTLGGSATTDGAAGALQALGARFTDPDGRELARGGGQLRHLAAIDLEGLVPPPAGGVRCLVDVTAPLIGPTGAAAQFGPQKGASGWEVRLLETGLRRLADLLRGDPRIPGSGAAGGTAYGLMSAWHADLVPGAVEVARVAGLPTALLDADLVVTGEGRFDEQSLGGKVVGHVLELAGARQLPVGLIAGVLGSDPPPPVRHRLALSDIAGGPQQAIAAARRWLMASGALLAESVSA